MPSSFAIKKHGVLPATLRKMIDAFFADRDWQGLFLTGGTCLAEYYFGHRLSVDMDLFTSERGLFEEARRFLGREDALGFGKMATVRSLPDFMQCLLHLGHGLAPIKIDLVQDIPVRLGEKINVEGVWIDSLPDLTANKINCLFQRMEPKDYIDFFYLYPAIDLPLPDLFLLAEKKDGGFDPLILAHQLRYIQTVERAPEFFTANVPWKQVRDFYRRLHDDILASMGA